MRVSIVAEDNLVVIDGVACDSDCRGLLGNKIRAFQWYGDHGEIEYVDHQWPNERIDSLDEFQSYIDAATAKPRFFEDTETPLRESIKKREANPLTRLGHFNPAPPPPVILGPDGNPVRRPDEV